ncbi:MAG TPA: hypothetical protein DD405_00920 [Desulfobacteraceae bacterium]|nr:hypothetical protein [Desulfobacteraceae bacterium]
MTKRPFIIPVFLPQMGCPHQCVFCNQNAITGITSRHLSSEKVSEIIIDFLKYRKDTDNNAQIAFYGGNFLGLKKDYIKLLLIEASKFIAAKKVDSIRFSTRPDTIDDQILDYIEKFSISTIEIGVQSMDDTVLLKSKRGHRAKDTVKAFDLLKKRNYITGAQMMVGLPHDDEETAIKTAEKIAALAPDFVRIYPTLVFSGSILASWYKKGVYVPMDLWDSVSLVKKIYLLFKKKGIRVIRMGLQATRDLDAKAAVLAGPYHPSFGHLVLSDIFLDRVISAVKAEKKLSEELVIKVHSKNISRMQGLKKRNVEILKKKFNFKTIRIIQDTSLGIDECHVVS